jgi:hypothetical protein
MDRPEIGKWVRDPFHFSRKRFARTSLGISSLSDLPFNLSKVSSETSSIAKLSGMSAFDPEVDEVAMIAMEINGIPDVLRT